MKHSLAKSKSTTLLPPLCPARRQTFDKKNEKMIIRDEKIKSIDSLSQVAEKLYIDGNKKCNITKKSVEEAVNKEEIIKSAYDYKKKITPLSDINRMSPQELQVSLRRITEIPQQPFSFLMDISKAFSDENHSSADTRDQRPSNIDTQLAIVAKRIESNEALLKEAKTRVEEMCLRIKQNDVIDQLSDKHTSVLINSE